MDFAIIKEELQFKASRSSGSGGQHVNKVATKVILSLNIPASKGLSEEEKKSILTKLANRINQEGILSVQSQNSRSQAQNRREALDKLQFYLEEAIKVPKKRKPVKMPRAIKEKRLRDKQFKSEKKEWRGKISPDDY